MAAAPRGRIPEGPSATRRMAGELRAEVGREMSARREGMIGPVSGRWEQAPGSRQLWRRGPTAMRGEWRPMAMAHDLLESWGSGRDGAMAG